jgi:hypothetical protein
MYGFVGSLFWSGTNLYARKDIELAPLLAGVPDLPAHAWLHRFVDRSSPRRGTDDLFFDEAPGTEIIPPAVVVDRRTHIPVPLDLLALMVAANALTMRLFRRKTA